MQFKHSVLAAAAAMALSAPAFAAFPNDCSVTDLVVNATACAGTFDSNGGNNLGAGNTALDELATYFGDIGWSLAVAELTATQSTAGTISFDLPVSGPFAIAIKSGSASSGGGYNLYYYDASNLNIASLEFNSTPAGKDLSHASLYVGQVPEPETYALMLAGLGAIGFMARRRRV